MSPEPPLDATGIARRLFSTVRKGYDPAEVRAYLHEVSDLVDRLQREEAHEHERAERAENRALLAEQLDEHRLVELLGEETARVLDAARKAAGEMRAKAEQSVARMVREARAEARVIIEQADKDAAARRVEILAEVDALRHQAEEEVARRRAEGQVIVDEMRRDAQLERDELLAEGQRARTEAEAAADQIRAGARDQGRRLVGEAQAVRERILTDLSRRRRAAREQLERLNGARERLLAAYEVVRRTVDEATTELTVVLPQARAASEAAKRRVSDEPEETVEMLEAELSVARMAGLVDDVAATAVSDEEFDVMLRELAEEEAALAAHAAENGDDAEDAEDAEDADGEPGTPAAGIDRADAAGAEPGLDDVVGAEPGPDDAVGAEPGLDDVVGAEPGPDDAVGPVAAPAGTAVAGQDAAGDAAAAGRDAPSAATEGAGPAVASSGGAAASQRRAGTPEAEAGAAARGRTPGPGAPRPQTDAEKWGVRLPRSRRSARQGADPTRSHGGEPPTPLPGPDASAGVPPAARSGAAPAAEDEGETGPYVDELFARIRSEREARDGGAAGSPEAAPAGDERGAVAMVAESDPLPRGPAPASEAGDEGEGQTAPERRDPSPAAGTLGDQVAEPGPHAHLEREPVAVREQRSESELEREPVAVREPRSEPEAAPEPECEVVDTPTRLLRQRDEALGAAERELGRKLKRVLADEQNEVLDLLRRRGSGVAVAEVIPAAGEHADRFAVAAAPVLDAVAAHGATLVGREAGSCGDLADTLGRSLAEPLRGRIERTFDECDGDLDEATERLRALYREWKANHIGVAVRHFTATAYARGAYQAVRRGSPLQWVVDTSCEACPDCDDNALAGKVVKGDAFPTGDTVAPAHPDCRCLVVPSDLLDAG